MTKILPRRFHLFSDLARDLARVPAGAPATSRARALASALTATLLTAAAAQAQPVVHAPVAHAPIAHAPVAHGGGISVGSPLFRVRVAPPAPRVEVRPVQPSPNHVWMSGAWRWNQGQHVWSPGRWELGHPGHIWVDPHWIQDSGQWVFYDGRWAPSSSGYQSEVVVATPPPPPQYEVVPNAYEPGQEWVSGHWEWHGERHIWIPGRYEVRPDHAHFENHRWERGQDNHWKFNRGRWHQTP